MNIDYDSLKINIESNSEVELNINELLSSAEIYKDDFIRVRNEEVTMIFDENYELVECYGEI